MTTITDEINQRVGVLAWDEITRQLDERGHAITPTILDAGECAELASLFEAGRFRSTIDMARYRFGDGRYRYFEHPLPELVAALRSSFYPYLAPIANRWSQLLRGENRAFPLSHEELLERCQKAGQHRPTPLILRYGEEDWNALHQDLYGDVFFPFQVLTVLSVRGQDFDGGEFVLLEQRPRAQSPRARAEPIPRRVRDLSHCRASEPRQDGISPHRHAARRGHRHPRRTYRAGDHFP